MKAGHNAASSPRHDYLVFRLADREYGIALERVRELCNYDVVKPVADAPPRIAGQVILQCRDIAVVNMHELLAPGSKDFGRLADVVILHDGDKVSGIAVDCVLDVVAVPQDQVDTQTPFAGLVGIASVGKRTIALLDADTLMTDFRLVSKDKLAA